MALLLLMLTLTVGAAGLLLSGRGPMSQASAQSSVQAEIDLARAAEAVVAYHIADDDNPGALVCPDYHPSGRPGDHDVGCLSNTSDEWFIGRLPWRELELPREYGRLWYVIDRDFRDDHNVSGSASTGPLNPGVDSGLSLNGHRYPAIIFDPGDPQSGQTGRPSYEVADYLEGGNASQDSTEENPEFVDCGDISNCNDRARGVSADKLFAAVQLRVIAELDPLFEAYYDNNGGKLPRAAPLGETACDSDTFRGLVPQSDSDCSPGSDEFIDPDGLPSWVVDNSWLDYIVYIVDSNCTAAGSGCGGGSLSVNGGNGVRRILVGAGPELPSQDRNNTALTEYLDMEKNTDGDDDFVTGPVTQANNDVIRRR